MHSHLRQVKAVPNFDANLVFKIKENKFHAVFLLTEIMKQKLELSETWDSHSSEDVVLWVVSNILEERWCQLQHVTQRNTNGKT
jgi:hypothetical protein